MRSMAINIRDYRVPGDGHAVPKSAHQRLCERDENVAKDLAVIWLSLKAHQSCVLISVAE